MAFPKVTINFGLLLFLVYLNNIPNCLNHTVSRMFADDTTGWIKKKFTFGKYLLNKRGAQNWRKLSVSPISLTPSGTSSSKLISNYIVLLVGNVLLKSTLNTACAQKWVTKHDIWIDCIKIWSMLYKLSKFWKIWCALRQTRGLKTLDISSLS